MALDGDWDLNGVHSRAYDDYNMLTFDEVCEIYKRRQNILKEKQEAKLEILHVKWRKE